MKIIERPSPNHCPRTLPVDMVILHYTNMRTAEEALDLLCDPEKKVSSHYLIDQTGHIFKLVEESEQAYHAGISAWKNRTLLNQNSLGIELDNPGEQFGLAPFPPAQMEALILLLNDIQSRHMIRPEFFLGHSDIAPGRKRDPGPLFDWRFLAQNGFGLYPDFSSASFSCSLSEDTALRALESIGYVLNNNNQLSHLVEAFQMHFFSSHCTGTLDRETLKRLEITSTFFSQNSTTLYIEDDR